MRLEDDSSTPGSKDPHADTAAAAPTAVNPLNNLNRMTKNEDIQFRSVPSVDVMEVDVEGVQLPGARDDDDQPVNRGQWSGKWDFLMACLSYAVGLGNLWRFPYLVYRNGGGAFLIPYITMNLLAGVPLFLSEMSIGQFSSSGAVNVWRLCPLFRGMGFAMVMVSGVVAPYYNMIIAWAFVFLYHSFTTTLPWSHCNNPWNTEECALKLEELKTNLTKQCAEQHHGDFKNGNCTYLNTTSGKTETYEMSEKFGNLTSPADEFFHAGVLQLSNGIHELGELKLELVLALFIAWFVVFGVIVKGPQSSGKVAYFTAIFPYVVLIILLIRGLTLPGCSKGIEFYITPNWTKMGEASVWADAAVQVTFSLSCGWGGVLTLASYKPFHGNILRDTYFITSVTAGTAIFSGFVIFSVIGFMAEALGKEVSDVAAEGAGLAFVAYPEAISKMPISPVWSVLFFAMILTLGIGTQIAIVTTVVSTIIDSSVKLMSRRLETTILFCVVGFLIGLPLCSGAGMYILQLLDNYVASWSIIIICICECFIFTFLYGVDRLLDDMACMIGYRPSRVWKYFWTIITPATLIFILVFTFVDMAKGKATKYNDYLFPVWADGLGLLISFISVLFIPAIAFYQIIQEEGPIRTRLRKLAMPALDWGPADPADRAQWRASTLHHQQAVPSAHMLRTDTAISTIPMLQNVINEEFMDSPQNSETNLQALAAAHGASSSMAETPLGPPPSSTPR